MKISALLDKRNNNLDLARIILACLVIVGHSPGLNGSSSFWIEPINYFFKFTYVGALAVKIFFFISGLVVTNSLLIKKSTSYFIISRSFRLIPALFFVVATTAFLIAPLLTTLGIKEYFANSHCVSHVLKNISFDTDNNLPGLFSNNLYKNVVNGSLWSLRYEVGCYIFLLGSFLILRNKNKYFLNIPIVIIVIDALLPTQYFFSFLGNNPEINLLPLSFALGAFFAINAEKIESNFNMVLGSILLLYIFRHSTVEQLFLIFAFFNATLYFASTKWVMELKPKYDLSYGIYLWGFLVQQALYQIVGHIYVGLHCLFALLISIALALLTHLCIEKPCINWGKIVYKFYEKKCIKSYNPS